MATRHATQRRAAALTPARTHTQLHGTAPHYAHVQLSTRPGWLLTAHLDLLWALLRLLESVVQQEGDPRGPQAPVVVLPAPQGLGAPRHLLHFKYAGAAAGLTCVRQGQCDETGVWCRVVRKQGRGGCGGWWLCSAAKH